MEKEKTEEKSKVKKTYRSVKKFIEDHSTELILGSVATLSFIGLKLIKKRSVHEYTHTHEYKYNYKELSDKQILNIIKSSGILKKDYFTWPFNSQLLPPDMEISNIPELGMWKLPLRSGGINTLNSLVKYIQKNGYDGLYDLPGIGERGVSRVRTFFLNNRTL